MHNLFRTAALALGTAATAAGAALSAAPARADDLTLSIGDGGPRVGLYIGDDGPRRWRDDDDDGPRGGWDRGPDDDWGPPRWDRRPPPPPPRCSPEQALDKAARMGLRRVRVVDVDRRTIDVSGHRHGERYVVTFARAPFCPVIR